MQRELGQRSRLDEALASAQPVLQDYQSAWSAAVAVVRPDGSFVWGREGFLPEDTPRDAASRARAIAEALRWGEATVSMCPRGRLQWAVPLMDNQSVIGGVVAALSEAQVFAGEGDRPALDTRVAGAELRHRLERANLTNAAALAAQRQQAHVEQQRAYALHAFKQRPHASVRELHLTEEPALMAAFRAHDQQEAEAVLRRMLADITFHAGERFAAQQASCLELAVTLYRAALDAGGPPDELLGARDLAIRQLLDLGGAAELEAWAVGLLSQLLLAVQRSRRQDPTVTLKSSAAYMQAHCHERISRDEVARQVGVSPSHFSRLLRPETGVTFTDMLNRMRVENAAERLADLRESVAEIAWTCGFSDQSYFTKVFKRYRKTTPRAYRRQRQRR